MVSFQGRIQNSFQGGGTNVRHFLSVVFSTDLILSNFGNKNDSRGSEDMLPRKIFEICTL